MTWQDVTCPRLWLTPGVITITQPLLTYVKGPLSGLSFCLWLGRFLWSGWICRERGEPVPRHLWGLRWQTSFPCLAFVKRALHCKAETILFPWQISVNVLCKALLRPPAERLLCLPVFTEGPWLLCCVLARVQLCQDCTLYSRSAAECTFHSRATKKARRRPSARDWWAGIGYQCRVNTTQPHEVLILAEPPTPKDPPCDGACSLLGLLSSIYQCHPGSHGITGSVSIGVCQLVSLIGIYVCEAYTFRPWPCVSPVSHTSLSRCLAVSLYCHS